MSNLLKRKMADGQSAEENVGPIETVGDQQQQQQKEFHEKISKMEMELKEANQLCKTKDFEISALQSELGKQNLMVENNALKAKIDMMEKEMAQQNEQGKYVSADQIKSILDRINELEKQQKEQSKANLDQLSKIQNDQKIILEKISEMDKEEKQKRTVLLNFQQNFWDATACHKNLEIIGDKNLTVHYKGNDCDWCSVFAKHPILLNKNSSDIFYYEISVKNKKCSLIIFGFTVKQKRKLDGTIQYEKDTYAYEGDGEIWTNGKEKGTNDESSYCAGDTVGIGVNSATRQIIFTKNGLRLDSSVFLLLLLLLMIFFIHSFLCGILMTKLRRILGPISNLIWQLSEKEFH